MLAKSDTGSRPKIKETGMEYCGIDLHAEYSQICILDEDGEVMETSRVRTSRKALERFFRRYPMRVVLEAGDLLPGFLASWSPLATKSSSVALVECG
jgi:hypothetical protein